MDLIRGVLGRRPERREANLSALLEVERSRGATWAGSYVSDYTAMQHLTVWSCVSIISDAVGMLPLHAYRPGPTVGSAPTRIETPRVMLQPHAELDRYEWDVRMLWSLLMRGNAYGWIIERDPRTFAPTQIEPVHPDSVRIVRDPQTFAVSYVVGQSRPVEVSPNDMMHVRGLVLPGSTAGLSPVEYARQTIGIGLSATEFGARLFGDGGFPGGVLSAEGNLDADTAAEYQDRWEEAHGGRSRRVAVLGGGLKWQAVQLAPEESQFLETRKFTRSEIAGFYRVPPHLIGDVDRSTSWGTGIEEQGSQFVTFTLGPWLHRLELAWTRQFAPVGIYARYNADALLRGKTLERFQAYTLARQGGWMNVDDVRAKEEMGPLPEGKGEDYLQPLNYAPIPPGGGAPDVQQPDSVTAPAP